MARTRAIKWTQEMRLFLYRRLVDKFGPHAAWSTTQYPSGQKEAYAEFLANIRLELSERYDKSFTADAIKNQIAWACTKQGEIKNRRYFENILLNKAPALEAGFIRRDELPEITRFEYKD